MWGEEVRDQISKGPKQGNRIRVAADSLARSPSLPNWVWCPLWSEIDGDLRKDGAPYSVRVAAWTSGMVQILSGAGMHCSICIILEYGYGVGGSNQRHTPETGEKKKKG